MDLVGANAADIWKGAIACDSCLATYDRIWGSPFLGHYEAVDVLGLIEIAANARADNSYAARQDVERLECLLRKYDEAKDKPRFSSACGDDFVRAPWFQNRYTEYAEFKTVSEGVTFVNRDVLDVGAGSGYDTWRLTQLGGRVTALEYNPMLVQRGRSVVPEARWIGGFAHVLPFQNETFDVVCCNAALHHMRDVPAAVHEMLRVLRPGGWLLTTGDPFRPDHTGSDHELAVFDDHPAVLLGVNESIPPLGELVRELVSHQDQLDVELHVPAFHGVHGRVKTLVARALGKKGWNLSERSRLASTGGSVAMKVRVGSHLDLDSRRQDQVAVRAGDYAELLGDYDAAVTSLVPLLPADLVDRPFPGDQQTKFELLNGWRGPRQGKVSRTGYKRARWFLTRPNCADALRFSVKRSSNRFDAALLVQVDGSPAAEVTPGSDRWAEATVPLDGVLPGQRFACELQIVLPDDVDAEFDDYCFAVKDRRFV